MRTHVLLLLVLLIGVVIAGCLGSSSDSDKSVNESNEEEEVLPPEDIDVLENETLDNETIEEPVELVIGNLNENGELVAKQIGEYYYTSIEVSTTRDVGDARIEFELMTSDYILEVNGVSEYTKPVRLVFEPREYFLKFRIGEVVGDDDSVLLQVSLFKDDELLDTQTVTIIIEKE